jgi:hypothetical protein
VPADGLRRLAEHAWKDGDSWRRDRRQAAIVHALLRDHFDDVGDRGGMSDTPALALRAIMEVWISLATPT